MKRKISKSSKSCSFLRSYEWKEIRVKALNRDNNECCLCGSHERLNVHHIGYRKFFKQHQLEMNNLVTVCTKCHWKIHKSIGNFLLMKYLMENRPEQWKWVVENIINIYDK